MFRRRKPFPGSAVSSSILLHRLTALFGSLPVVEFPHSPSRLTAATTDLFSAAVNGKLSHSGDTKLAAHVAAAVITEDARGMRLSKASRKSSARKIDLAACLVMAHSRATWRATRKPTRRRSAAFT